jgi:uncharacterized iron-regulated membrane protein
VQTEIHTAMNLIQVILAIWLLATVVYLVVGIVLWIRRKTKKTPNKHLAD